MNRRLILLALLTFGATSSFAAPEEGSVAERRKQQWAFTPDETLPNVLILGDSISIGYTLQVRALLAGKANVFRPLKHEGARGGENCSGTTKGVTSIERWLGDRKWDVIHFNFGLHDITTRKVSGKNFCNPWERRAVRSSPLCRMPSIGIASRSRILPGKYWRASSSGKGVAASRRPLEHSAAGRHRSARPGARHFAGWKSLSCRALAACKTEGYCTRREVGWGAPSPYTIWAVDPAQGLTIGVNDGPLKDLEGDGIGNLLEFVLGGHPLAASQSILPTVGPDVSGWVFEYERSNLSAPPATTQVVEYGSDLVGWTPVAIPLTSAGIVTITPGSPSDHVSVAIPDLGAIGFARLKVSE